jgi:YHS domain-containing protein
LLRRQCLQAATGLVGAFVVGIAPASSHAQAQTGTDRLGLKGYDPVAYFTLSAPTPGVAQYEYVYDGSRYRFANARHLAMFKANPEKYAPQFGGLCANNMSNGVRRESDPAVWIIANDRLYVFAGTAGRDRFRLDPTILGARAASNWRDLKNTTSQ